MDCRRCNFYLCAACCSYQERGNSIAAFDWGYVSALPFYALDHIEDVALDVNDFFQRLDFSTPSIVSREPGHNQTARFKRVAKRSVCSDNQKTVFISDFCHKFPATNIVPTDLDLNGLWSKCETLPPEVVADAIDQQLSFASGDHDWQPRFRALYALENFMSREGKGEEISDLVLINSEELIRHLGSIPQCRDKVHKLLVKLEDADRDS